MTIAITLDFGFWTLDSRADFTANDSGSRPGQFLKVGSSARADALGGAYGALGNDWAAMSYNPALLAQVSRAQVGATYSDQDNEIAYGHAAWASPIWKLGQFGLNASYLTYGDLSGYDDSGFETDAFSPQDLAVGLGWAKAIPLGRGFLAPGLAVKMIQMKITETASATAFDAGLFFKYGRFGLGISAANWGGKIQFIGDEEKLPQIQRVGLGLKIFRYWRVSADYVRSSDSDDAITAGSEIGIPLGDGPKLNLRFGMNTLLRSGSLEGMSGYAAGFGFQDEILDVDYAFIPMGNLGETHKVSIGVRFGDPHLLP
ncbi:MAG: PorV/PorQ family protein [Elusimicrobia bacterium]|nr:PorV/PorQ family protein [Elusimicrobiota bacterium]